MHTRSALIDAAAAPADAQLSSLEELVDALLGVIPADPQWYALRALYGLRAGADSELPRVRHEHGDEFQSIFTALLTQVAQAVEGELVPAPDVAVRVVTAAHVGAVLQGQLVDDPESLRRNAVLGALRGVLSSSARASLRPQGE